MDARKHDRARLIYRLRVRGVGSGTAFTGQLIDATPRGLMLMTNTSLAAGSRLSLTVEPPRNTMNAGDMVFETSVRWCEPLPADYFYRLGVQLETVPAASGERLQTLMKRFHEHPLANSLMDERDPYAQSEQAGLFG